MVIIFKKEQSIIHNILLNSLDFKIVKKEKVLYQL